MKHKAPTIGQGFDQLALSRLVVPEFVFKPEEIEFDSF